MLNNLQFVAYVKQAYADKWVYWYGTCGYKCTQALYDRKKEQYPSHYTAARKDGYMADIRAGRMCADCVGLIKSFFWKGGDINGANKYESNGCPDTSANGMIALCKDKGPISSIPDIPGLVVWKDGHIGVYIGGGYTIEERGFSYDCVMRKVKDGPWTKWGRLPPSMLEYTDAPVKVYELGERTLSKGDTGPDVAELQRDLMQLGYTFPKYGADGDFGSETEANVKTFQLDHGLSPTGVFDSSAYKALTEALNTPDDMEPPAEEPDTPDGGGEPAWVLILTGDRKRLELVQLAYGGILAEVDSVKVVEA